MTSAQVRSAALALALGMGSAAAAHADANATHLPAGSETCWRPDASASGSFEGFRPSSPNVAVDPRTGTEVYVPTGETIDQVLPVVAPRIPQPAVASVGTGSTGPTQPSDDDALWNLVYEAALPGSALLAFTGWLLMRRRRGAASASTRVGLVL
jgi:hypothetical protein